MKTEKDILICKCYSTEHQMVFYYSDEDGKPMIFVHILLNKKPILKRIKLGLMYILGYQSRFGMFDEFIINADDREKFEKVLNYLKP